MTDREERADLRARETAAAYKPPWTYAETANQALFIGQLLGSVVKMPVDYDVELPTDDEGNYLNYFTVSSPSGEVYKVQTTLHQGDPDAEPIHPSRRHSD